MEQRTCNIAMCCKGHCELPGGKDQDSLTAVAAYMSHECACPQKDYKGRLMESIMKEALFDFLKTASNPSFEVRQLLDTWYGDKEPTLSERIASMFGLTQVNKDGRPTNGFTPELLAQSEIDLGAKPGLATGVPDPRPRGPRLCGGCVDYAGNPGPNANCGNCSRRPGEPEDTAKPDLFRPAPGTFCGDCSHRTDQPGATGEHCGQCRRASLNFGRSGLPDMYEKGTSPDRDRPACNGCRDISLAPSDGEYRCTDCQRCHSAAATAPDRYVPAKTRECTACVSRDSWPDRTDGCRCRACVRFPDHVAEAKDLYKLDADLAKTGR